MLTNVIAVLGVLAVLAFLLEIGLERIKSIFPFLNTDINFNLGNQKFSIKLFQFISLGAGIALMFAIGQPICIFAAAGYAIPLALSHIFSGIIVSGGSSYIYDIIKTIKTKNISGDQ